MKRRAWPGLIVPLAASACAGAAAIAPPLEQAGTVRDAADGEGAAASLQGGISEALFYAGSLWLRGHGGALAALDPQSGRLRRHLGREQVVDIHVTGQGALWALTVNGESDDARVWSRGDRGWTPIGEMAAPSSPLVALADVQGRPVVLARRSAFTVDGRGRLQGRALDQEIPAEVAGQPAFAVTDLGVGFVGTSDGDVGGAIFRVELASGHVERLACDGADGTGCGRVTGIVRDPGQHACVLVGIGVLDPSPAGRLLRVCDRAVSIAWEAPRVPHEVVDARMALAPFRGTGSRADICDPDAPGCPSLQPEIGPEDAFGPGRGREAVLGLSALASGLAMVTDAALYRMRGDRFERHDLPRLARHGSIAIGAALGIWLLDPDIESARDAPLVAAAPEGTNAPALPAAEAPPPHGTCWLAALEGPRDRALVVCLAADRFFARDEQGWNSGLLSWRREPGTGWSLELASGERLRLRLDRRGATVRRSAGTGTRLARLERVDALRLASLRREIDALARVEAVCSRARSCSDLARRAGVAADAAAFGDLRSCGSTLAWTVSEMRGRRLADADAAAWRACQTP